MIERVWIIRDQQGCEVVRVLAREGGVELLTFPGGQVLTLGAREADEVANAISEASVEVEP